jgi:AAA domain
MEHQRSSKGSGQQKASGSNNARPDNAHQMAASVREESSTWTEIDLGLVLDGKRIHPPPSILAREDGHCLLYAEKIHRVFGEKETGKGWLVLLAAKEQLVAGEHVAYLDFEDDEITIVERLRALGVADAVIRERFHYLRPDESFLAGGEAVKAELAATLDCEPSMVIFDGQTEALAVEGIDIIDNSRYAIWLRRLPRWILSETGAAIVIIDHRAKDGGTKGAIGAQHKGAGIDVEYEVTRVSRFGRGINGKSKVKLEKDRPGYQRRQAIGSLVTTMEVESGDDGALAITLRSPEPWTPTELMLDVSVLIKAMPGLTGNQVVERITDRRRETVLKVLQMLVEDGYVRPEPRSGGGFFYHHVRDYLPPAESGTGSAGTSPPAKPGKRRKKAGTSKKTGTRRSGTSGSGSSKPKAQGS